MTTRNMTITFLSLLFFLTVGTVSSRHYPLCFAAKGFGASTTSAKKKGGGAAATVALSKEAKKLLKKHGNNVDAASGDYFQSQIERMVESASIEDMHAARVAATWNTVALFLPQDYKRTKGKVEPHVDRRLRLITSACGCSDTNKFELLDVGCGDGAIVPYLPPSCQYSGVDLSSEMIALGQRRFPDKTLWVGGFPESVPPSPLYDTILFNGSLQFFRDTKETLQQAAALLKPTGRIVLTHVNGAQFVRDECRKNPSVAVRKMPNDLNLGTMAQLLDLEVVEKAQLLQNTDYDEDLDGDAEKFYLVALQKRALFP